VNDRDKASERTTTAEAVGRLVWLLDSAGLDRRRYRIMNRLRSMSESDEFATLPEDLRERVREIIADSER
jgi:plasmid replication initiation protein